jgi:serine/threonine protein kinase
MDGSIAGLSMQRYPRILADVIPYGRQAPADDGSQGNNSESEHSDPEQLDRAAILRGIVSGVIFLHSLGLVHNDLNPRNIILSSATPPSPIIIDFDSCKPLGTSMKGQKSFTASWARRNPLNVSVYENDYLSLGLLERYLGGIYF